MTTILESLPCPFCGKPVDLEDYDTLYPSGVFWREDKELMMRTYHSRKNSLPSDRQCYAMHCPVTSGGCGAQISGDSEAEALSAWNRRSNVEFRPLDAALSRQSRWIVGLDNELEEKMKLTKAQERAKAKLTDQWQCAYTLQETIPTLEGLVRRGEAVQKREREGLGAMFCPRTTLSYKLKVSNAKSQATDAALSRQVACTDGLGDGDAK